MSGEVECRYEEYVEVEDTRSATNNETFDAENSPNLDDISPVLNDKPEDYFETEVTEHTSLSESRESNDTEYHSSEEGRKEGRSERRSRHESSEGDDDSEDVTNGLEQVKHHDDSGEVLKNSGVDIETGTTVSRRKALEKYAEETTKSHSNSPRVIAEDASVLTPGKAANTRAQLERMCSEEKVLEKPIDVNTPITGTASARRAAFEEKAKQASLDLVTRPAARTARRSKWPEPNTNYRRRRDSRHSVSADEEATTNIERENAKNIEKSRQYSEPNDKTENNSSPTDHSSDEALKSSVKTAEIRNKFVRMSSNDEERATSPPADLGNVRPSVGTARNLRAKFEANKDETQMHSMKPNIVQSSGHASRVKERFESGEAARRTPVTDHVDGGPGKSINEPEQDSVRRRHLSSPSSDSTDTNMMQRSAKDLKSRFENPTENTQVVKRNFVVRPKQPGNNISSKFNKVASTSNKCVVCLKTVYPMEMITADNKIFHKKCFKCAECKATLRLGNYAALQGQIYCKPHFKQLFKVKGNYDEGFGREQHKKNWEAKPHNDRKSDENGQVDANGNIKGHNSPHENGYDDNQTNGFHSTRDDGEILT